MNGWYALTRAYTDSLDMVKKPTLIEWAKIYDIDLDDDVEAIREQVFLTMSRKESEDG